MVFRFDVDFATHDDLAAGRVTGTHAVVVAADDAVDAALAAAQMVGAVTGMVPTAVRPT